MDEKGQLDLFSGIGGFSVAAERAGFGIVSHCETDDKASQVLRCQWPKTPNLGNICGVTRKSVSGRIDLITGGFPCQDVSVAGNRKGLAGKRSGLWFEFHRIIGEFQPRIVVIENVPGLLSSRGGDDFAAIIRGLGELGYCAAWRVLDAQYAGLAQRRERVFIVGSFGNGSCAEILFESESVRWNPAPSRSARQDVVAALRGGAAGGSGHGKRNGEEHMTMIPFDIQQITSKTNRTKAEPGIPCSTLGGNGQMHVAGTLAASGAGTERPAGQCNEPDFLIQAPVVATNLSEDGTGRGTPIVAFAQNQVGEVRVGEVMNTLNQNSNASGRNTPMVKSKIGVRRLTPRECERLQGFPDGWTRYGIDGKGRKVEMSDSARYRMLGNAVAVPVVEWILRRAMKSLNGGVK